MATGVSPLLSFLHSWRDVRRRFLFRHLLVANIRTDHLRRFPADARVFSAVLRHRRRRDLSRHLRIGAFDLSTPLRHLGISACSLRLGFYGVSAVLGNRK